MDFFSRNMSFWIYFRCFMFYSRLRTNFRGALNIFSAFEPSYKIICNVNSLHPIFPYIDGLGPLFLLAAIFKNEFVK